MSSVPSKNPTSSHASLPVNMRSVLAKSFGRPEDVLYMSAEHPRPVVKPGSGKLLVRVLAMSLSPGDWRTLSGSASLVRHPKFPYVPCHDVCGTVVEVDPKLEAPAFKLGDCVIGTWDMMAEGGLAEYALVDSKLTVLKPEGISTVDAAALANSAGHALEAVRHAKIKEGDRVLVLGAGGGFGTAFVQLARDAGASYVAATCTNEAMQKSIGVDRVIDHRTEQWWTDADFLKEPFDVIVDAAEGKVAWERAKAKSSPLKSGKNGGRFLAVVMPNPTQEFKNPFQMIGFMGGFMAREAYSKMTSGRNPRYIQELTSLNADILKEVLAKVQEGKLNVILDPASPFAFTEEGVKEAFKLQASTLHPKFYEASDRRGPHGKIVIRMAAEDEVQVDICREPS